MVNGLLRRQRGGFGAIMHTLVMGPVMGPVPRYLKTTGSESRKRQQGRKRVALTCALARFYADVSCAAPYTGSCTGSCTGSGDETGKTFRGQCSSYRQR